MTSSHSHHTSSVYRSTSKREIGFVASLIGSAKAIRRAWPLILVLFKRDFFAGYKRAALGIGWLVIAPILGMASWMFMQRTGVLSPGKTNVPYPAFVLVGSSVWTLFVGVFNSTAESLTVGSSFILQVNFPHEALVAKQVLQQIANFAIAFALTLLALALFGVTPAVSTLLAPFLLVPLVLLGIAMGLLCSLLFVLVPDAKRVSDFGFGLMVFATPIFYSSSAGGDFLKRVIKLNPLSYLVSLPRDAVFGAPLENLRIFGIISAACLVFFLLAFRVFLLAEQRVLERLL